MQNINDTFHGLKAAAQLLVLLEGAIASGAYQVQLQDIAIDFEDGTSREFSPEDYFDLAKRGVETATQIIKKASAHD